MIKQIDMQRTALSMAHYEYKKSLTLHAYFKIQDFQRSEDLVQEVFMKAWNYFMRGGHIKQMQAFLFHVLDNLIVDEYRKHKTSSLDLLLEKGFEPGVVQTESLMDYLDGKSAMHLIEELPSAYQNIMEMRYIKDMSLSEISKITGLSKNTLAVKLHRGLKKLKTIYNREGVAQFRELPVRRNVVAVN